MIRNFANRTANEIWESDKSRVLPQDLWIRAKALLTIMHSTSKLSDLKSTGAASPHSSPQTLLGTEEVSGALR